MLATVETVTELLARGKTLILAGEESLLRAIPKGAWVGGTIPYFMTEAGGVTSRTHVFVEEVPAVATSATSRVYDGDTVSRVGVDSPEHGYSIVIVPAMSSIHQTYAVHAPRDGWIEALPYEVGERPPVGAPVAVMLAAGPPYARVHVPETLRASYAAGRSVTVRVE